MSDKFTFSSAGEIQEVEFALARHGWTHSLLKKATGGEFFGLVREALEGRAEICRIERLTAEEITATLHIINCDADPFVPSGLAGVESHQKSGQFVFDPSKIDLYLSKKQKIGKVIKGDELLKELANKPVLNANVLDYLLAHPELIPESWKGKAVFFWGTIYRGSFGFLFVRCLCFRDGEWHSDYSWLDRDWLGSNPAALLAS